MPDHFHAHMDRNIFKLNLPVETTSAYILVASMIEQSLQPSLEEIRNRWTQSDATLDEALAELIHLRILKPVNTPAGVLTYQTNPSSLWRSPIR